MRLKPPFGWMLRRSRPSPMVTLDLRRVYILPTREGMMFAGILFLMLIASINYTLSLGFALTFLLAATSLVSMLHTYRNLAGIRLLPGKTQPVFAGKTANFMVEAQNEELQEKHSIVLEMNGRSYDLPASGGIGMEFEIPAPSRGRLRAPRFTLSTVYPLGLFRAWSYVELEMGCIVYPRPEKPSRSPEKEQGGKGKHPSLGRDDFAGLRNYRLGDSMHHIAWKALAREKGLFTKEFSSQEDGRRIWLDWDSLHGIDTETRLSQLTQMALDAHEAHRHWGLRLPGKTIAFGQGDAHLARTLEALALWGLE